MKALRKMPEDYTAHITLMYSNLLYVLCTISDTFYQTKRHIIFLSFLYNILICFFHYKHFFLLCANCFCFHLFRISQHSTPKIAYLFFIENRKYLHDTA